jgi:coproporphyrinogen III oxidase-like Fe-S oxidoreductase
VRMGGWPRASPYVCRLPNPGKHVYPPPIEPVSLDEYLQLTARVPAPDANGQLYVHVPFCATLCTFCPIHKQVLPNAEIVDGYVEAVLTELDHLSELPFVRALTFSSVYFGGGTPSVLPDRHIAALVDRVASRFRLSRPQMTFEGHVASLTTEKMRLVRDLGFNRLSTGIQTFDRALRRMLNLTPTEEDIIRCVASARELGFADFNVDLMYNLPGQTAAIWQNDLRKAIALEPTGLDLYESVIASGTRLYRDVKEGRVVLEMRPTAQAQPYTYAEDMLHDHGYTQKNLFAWDRPGFENIIIGHAGRLRSVTSHLVGAGLSAFSMLSGTPFVNWTGRRDYVTRVKQTGFGVRNYHPDSEVIAKERFMIMSLADLAFDANEYRIKFGSSMEHDFARQLRSFAARGLTKAQPGGYALTRDGRAWAMTMAIEFYGTEVLAQLLRQRIDGDLFFPLTHEEEFQLPLFALFHPDVILRRWSDYALIGEYIAYLRRRDATWLRKFALHALRTAPRRGLPLSLNQGFKLLAGALRAA